MNYRHTINKQKRNKSLNFKFTNVPYWEEKKK